MFSRQLPCEPFTSLRFFITTLVLRRYWLFAHHRLNKEVFEDRQRAESRANGGDANDEDF
jgi:hypothetical protein